MQESAGPVNFKVQDEPLRPRPTVVRIFRRGLPTHEEPMWRDSCIPRHDSMALGTEISVTKSAGLPHGTFFPLRVADMRARMGLEKGPITPAIYLHLVRNGRSAGCESSACRINSECIRDKSNCPNYMWTWTSMPGFEFLKYYQTPVAPTAVTDGAQRTVQRFHRAPPELQTILSIAPSMTNFVVSRDSLPCKYTKRPAR